MSSFIGASDGLSVVLHEDDDRLKPQYATFKHQSVIIRDACKDPVGYSPFTGSWWPGGGRRVLGDSGDVNVLQAVWHDLPEVTRGHSGTYYIRGYTRDANGNALGGVTIKLFRTSDDSLQDADFSAADGSYALNTGYTTGHYIVAYLSGGGTVPDVEGTTLNTLTPGV